MKSIFIGVGDRGGNRGGKDQFDWNDVKGDKYKDFYLGSSVKAGRQTTDVSWVFRGKKEPDLTADEALEKEEELKRIRQEEALLRKAELGLAPKDFKKSQVNLLEQHELAELFARGMTRIELDDRDPDRVAGLGFANTAFKDKAPFLPKEAVQSTLLEENYYPAPDQFPAQVDGAMVWVEKGKLEKKQKKEKKVKDKKTKKNDKRSKKKEMKNFKKLYNQVRKEGLSKFEQTDKLEAPSDRPRSRSPPPIRDSERDRHRDRHRSRSPPRRGPVRDRHSDRRPALSPDRHSHHRQPRRSPS